MQERLLARALLTPSNPSTKGLVKHVLNSTIMTFMIGWSPYAITIALRHIRTVNDVTMKRST